MNRYLIEGILRDVRAGKRVVIMGRLAIGSNAFEHLTAATDDWVRVRRTSGRESAEHPSGGSVLVRAATPGFHRPRADVVVTIGYRELNEREQGHVRALAATGELILAD
ncbi:hypothetical protein [Georgenia wangjunii]|uniref:hypothetical protein n=1 Tax=Georgenia wangjunii TaxID=3117730 RepID=UPI002F26022E